MKTLIALIVALMLQNPNVHTVEGKFYYEFEAISMETNKEETLYQFKSDDDSVWWLLTAEEIGHVPDFETKYALTYDDKGTTAGNKTCDCLLEWECECALYDDEFIRIKKSEE